MHLEIDKLYFNGSKVGIDFEYDEDFRNMVAEVCDAPHLSKKQLQLYVISVLQNTISREDILELKHCIEEE
jgi:hypothetical protein